MVARPEADPSLSRGDMLDADGRELIATALSSSWPDHAREGTRAAITTELTEFFSGRGASLPFFANDSVAWVTLAPSSGELHREIQLLRAWVIPSFGWEDRIQPFVTPGDKCGRLASDLLGVSPAGYFKWRCARKDFATVAERLTRMRGVLGRRPEHVHDRVPSLLELRQQFAIALVTGARGSAEAAVRAIDNYQLDSAVNTQLMRVRILDQFGDYSAIVDDPGLERLLGLRLPHAVRVSIARAFYSVYLAPRESDGPESSARAYAESVHPAIGGMLTVMAASDAPEVERSLAYRAWVNKDGEAAAALLSTADDWIAPLLGSVLANEMQQPARANPLDAFHDAIHRGDVRAIQRLAPAALASLDSGSDARREVATAVRDTLDTLPNAAIAEALATSETDALEPRSMPQSWSEMLARLRSGDVGGVARFLALDHGERPGPDQLSPEEREAVVASLEELLTDPALVSGAQGSWVVEAALPAFVEDFVSESLFPRAELAPLYQHLFRLWATHKRGSTYAPDGQVLIMLATAMLERSSEFEREATQGLIDWWRTRPIPAALPFLIEALDVVLDFMTEASPGQQLWLDGATMLGRDPDGFSATERSLWRRLGRRAGFDDTTIDEVMPPRAPDQVDENAIDWVASSGLSKIAIVSLHRRAADEARDLIAERSGATVFVVDEMVAGPATKRAQTADAILFVWAATKHAVFRAFDGVRDKVVYVQGSGAGSIVLALERWLARGVSPRRQ